MTRTRVPTSVTRRTLRIDRLAAGGDGVARDGGLVVFVPRSAPGDVIEADVTHDGRARFARGALVRVLEPSDARVTPPCAHYVHDRCGGCQLQHLTYDAQVHAKGAIVAEAFRRIAKRELHVPTVHTATHPWGYRRKLTLALRRNADATWRAGLHAFDDPSRVFPLASCALAEPAVMQAWHRVLTVPDSWPDAHELRVAIRRLGDGVAMAVAGGMQWPEVSYSTLADAVPALRAIWWIPEAGRRRLVLDRRDAAEPGASFVQVNPAMQAVLSQAVLALVRSYAPRTVIDAYAGAGDGAVAIAAMGARVTALEADAEASDYCASRLPAGSRAIRGLVEHTLADALPADIVVLNPPRAGCDGAVMAQLAASRPVPRAVIYVSCDPATLARDVGRLPGWRVAQVACFDMFPQTAHVETVCELVPEAA